MLLRFVVKVLLGGSSELRQHLPLFLGGTLDYKNLYPRLGFPMTPYMYTHDAKISRSRRQKARGYNDLSTRGGEATIKTASFKNCSTDVSGIRPTL